MKYIKITINNIQKTCYIGKVDNKRKLSSLGIIIYVVCNPAVGANVIRNLLIYIITALVK